jgi:hypothetical protein
MATITSGLVEYVKVGDDFGFVQIKEDGTGDLETLIIWFSDSGPGGPVGFWTLQLMTALAQRLPLDISHEDNGAFILQVKVRAPA